MLLPLYARDLYLVLVLCCGSLNYVLFRNAIISHRQRELVILLYFYFCIYVCVISSVLVSPLHATVGWSAIVALLGHTHSFPFLIALLNVLGIVHVCVS